MSHWRKNHESASGNLMSADLFDEKKSAETGRPEYFSPIVTIAKMTSGKVKSREKPKGEQRNFMHFKGKDKPLGLNVTNCETLTSLSGTPDVARWVGMTIRLFVDKAARYPSGQTGPAIRISPELPEAKAQDTALPELSEETRERLDTEHEERMGETGT